MRHKLYCGHCGFPWEGPHANHCPDEHRRNKRNIRAIPVKAKSVALRLREQANQMERIPDPGRDHLIREHRYWADVILNPNSTEAQVDEAVRLNMGSVDMWEPMESDYNYARRVQMGSSY